MEVQPEGAAPPAPWWRALAAWRPSPAAVVVLGASLLFRIPLLINANAINSDGAVVALQAQHMLRGEWSPFLWVPSHQPSYQSSLDAMLMAAGFALFGVRPWVAMAVPLAEHLLLTWLAFDLLRRRLDPWRAAVACVPLVFAPIAITLIIQYGARQAFITLVFAAIWCLDGASSAKRPLLRLGLGSALATLSLYLDLYGLQLLPALALLALLCAFDRAPERRQVAARLAASAGGAVAGLIPVLLVWRLGNTGAADGSGSVARLALDRISRNASLLWEQCLPFLLGYKVWTPGHQLYADLWTPPVPFRLIQILGALAFGVAMLSGLWLVRRRGLPWEVRRLGPFGVAAAAVSTAAFLVSVMPSDQWSARYLAPMVWMAPFAVAPLLAVLRSWRRAALALAPYAISAAVAGWLEYGLGVRGPLPVREPRAILDGERKVQALLRERGVHHGVAHYWLAYRLTFLMDEDPIVIPFSPGDDRYTPYRQEVDRAGTVAYIFHPSEPRATPEPAENQLRAIGARYERFTVDGFTVFIHHRQ